MKLIGKYVRTVFNQDGDLEITLAVNKRYWQTIQTLDPNKYLDIRLDDKKSQRTLRQNDKLWALIHDIDKKVNGRVSEEGEGTIYRQIIKQAKIRTEYIQALEKAQPILEQTFRCVVPRERRTSDKGVEVIVYECYIGSSQFSKEEMADFIDSALDYAERAGVEDVVYYREELK